MRPQSEKCIIVFPMDSSSPLRQHNNMGNESLPQPKAAVAEPVPLPDQSPHWAAVLHPFLSNHYTEGWADGFHHTISHWEIWNEPESWEDPEKNEMWHGTFEEYCDFYEVASKHLKAQFPHLMIGGYASCGVGAAAEREEWHPDARARNCDDHGRHEHLGGD